MTVKDVLKSASLLLTKLDLLSALDSNSIASSFTRDINLLIGATNLVINEIVSDYVPIYKSEDIEVSTGKYAVSSLSATLLAIRHLKSEAGYNVKYTIESGYILLPNGKFNIKYSYLPAKVTALSDSLSFLDPQITDRVIAYGVVSEYYLINGLYSEAKLWRDKFESGVNSASKRLSNIVMRGKVWE